MVTETQVVEWKSSWRDEYLKWICGFANAQGGVLEVGKNDDGVVVGVADARSLLEEIPNKINSTMGIVADVDLCTDDGLNYLVITVLPYPNPISYHGKYYIRSGATNRELTGNALDEFMLRKYGRTWDGSPVPYVKVSDLDDRAIREFRTKALTSRRLTEADLDISDPALIDSLRLAEGKYLKRAAVLLFHEDPEKWVTGAYIKIGYFETGADLRYQDEVHGPLITMADRVMDIIYTKYFRDWISYKGIQRVDAPPVPRDAMREAILNAVIHRDYSVAVPIQIKVFPDKVMIFSQGGLPENWTVDELWAHHQSKPRNPDIANAFYRSGQIEVWGRGIEKIEEACLKDSAPPPVFKSKENDVQVTFPFVARPTTSRKHSLVDVIDDGADVIETGVNVIENVIENDSNVIETDSNVIENVIENGLTRPSKTQMIIAAMLDNPKVTWKELARIVGVTERTVARLVGALREAGVIQRIGPDKGGHWIVSGESVE